MIWRRQARVVAVEVEAREDAVHVRGDQDIDDRDRREHELEESELGRG